MEKETLKQKVERLEKEINELRKDVYFVKAIATGGIKTDVVYTYTKPHLEATYKLGQQSNLESLIEKVGIGFYRLEVRGGGSVGEGPWHAMTHKLDVYGSTPTEAVENLIKALENK